MPLNDPRLLFFHLLPLSLSPEKVSRFVCHQCRPALVQKIERMSAAKREAAGPEQPAKKDTSVSTFMSKLLTPMSEKDRALRKKKEREERMREMSKVWREEVIPHWSKFAGGRKMKELCWNGIPPNLRKDVWPLLVGNRLSISEELFEIHGGRAFEVRKQSSLEGSVLLDESSSSNKEQSVMLIPVDIGRTFPLLGFFQEEGPQHEELRHVLEAYVCLRPDVGYVQGMSFMAAVLLLNLDCYTSFQCLANLLNRKIFLEFFRMNMIQIRKYMLVLEDLVAKYLPKIWAHFEEIRLTPDMYIIDWVLTLFSKALPLDLAMRVWDSFFYEGTVFIYRVALGILKYGATVLETGDFEECLTWLTHLSKQDLVEEDLFDTIKSVGLSRRVLEELFGSYGLEIDHK